MNNSNTFWVCLPISSDGTYASFLKLGRPIIKVILDYNKKVYNNDKNATDDQVKN